MQLFAELLVEFGEFLGFAVEFFHSGLGWDIVDARVDVFLSTPTRMNGRTKVEWMIPQKITPMMPAQTAERRAGSETNCGKLAELCAPDSMIAALS